MRKVFLTVFAAAVCCMTAYAQDDSFPESMPTMSSTIFEQSKYSPTVFYMNDVVYATKGGKDLHLQIMILSMQQKTPLPCIVYVQGSAWMKQNVYMNLPSLARFAQRGYVVAIVEYRDTCIEPFPAQTVDAKTAIRFLRMNASRYGIDPESMVVWGDSSGGHTALMIAVTQDDPGVCEDDMYGDVSCKVKAAVAYYPPTDASVMKDYPSTYNHNDPDSPEGLLIGGKVVADNIELAKKASPLYYVSREKALVPIFLAAGTMDRTVPFSQTDIFAKKLSECGKNFRYYALKGADHGSWEFWTEEMFDEVESWIKSVLK